jgi:hypothetical protein
VSAVPEFRADREPGLINGTKLDGIIATDRGGSDSKWKKLMTKNSRELLQNRTTWPLGRAFTGI